VAWVFNPCKRRRLVNAVCLNTSIRRERILFSLLRCSAGGNKTRPRSCHATLALLPFTSLARLAKPCHDRLAHIHKESILNLILTADDFGRSHEINQAVVRAHRAGTLTAASLMVAGSAADEAIAIARENPKLAIGLHLVAVDGPAVLSPDQIPDLVDRSGRFPNAPARLGVRYALSPGARRQLKREIEAQFARFAESGLPLSHVDGHQHMHLHPVIFPMIVPLAARYGAKRVRIVRDDLRLSLRHDRTKLLTRCIWAASFAWLGRLARRHLRGTELIATGRVYGLLQSGRMTEDYVLDLLKETGDPRDNRLAEIYFHPTIGDRTDAWGPNPGDFRTLLNPAVRSMISANGCGW
jgi:hopanoid biosynthesis associated protein HpnK